MGEKSLLEVAPEEEQWILRGRVEMGNLIGIGRRVVALWL